MFAVSLTDLNSVVTLPYLASHVTARVPREVVCY